MMVNVMEGFVKKSLLFDFYGELLTEHQRRIYQEILFDDFSISEVARDEGISRQGVHDMVRRCERTLEDYEERLHLVERFLKIRDAISRIFALTGSAAGDATDAGDEKERMRQIAKIAEEIRREL